MKLTCYASVAVMLLGFASAPCLAEVHDHEHAAGSAKLQLNKGKKWATDQSLRLGMSRINAVFASKSSFDSGDRTTERAYVWLAQKIQVEVTFIMQNCKLDKEPDAMLHIVLADLIDGADVMQGNKPNQKPYDGVVKARQALKNYAAYFDHPGWK